MHQCAFLYIPVHSYLSLSLSLCIYQSIIIDFLRQSIRLCTCPTQYFDLSLFLSLSLSLSIYIYIYRLICINLWLSACASQLIHIYLSIYLRRFFESVYQTVCLSNPLYSYVCIYLSIYLSIPADLYSSIYQTVCVLSQLIYIYLSIYLSIPADLYTSVLQKRREANYVADELSLWASSCVF